MAKRYCESLKQFISSKQCGLERNKSIQCADNCEYKVVAEVIAQRQEAENSFKQAIKDVDELSKSNPFMLMALMANNSKRKRTREVKKEDCNDIDKKIRDYDESWEGDDVTYNDEENI